MTEAVNATYTPPWLGPDAAPPPPGPDTSGTVGGAPEREVGEIAPVRENQNPVMDFDGMPMMPPASQSYAAKLERFAIEYMVDMNACSAALRIGATEDAIRCGYASKLLNHPYTQQLIANYIREWEEDAICTRNQIKAALWREANYYGPDGSAAARVAALGKLMRLMGMDIQKIESTSAIGVMVVPMTTGPEQWAQLAEQQQLELKEAVGKLV